MERSRQHYLPGWDWCNSISIMVGTKQNIWTTSEASTFSLLWRWILITWSDHVILPHFLFLLLMVQIPWWPVRWITWSFIGMKYLLARSARNCCWMVWNVAMTLSNSWVGNPVLYSWSITTALSNREAILSCASYDNFSMWSVPSLDLCSALITTDYIRISTYHIWSSLAVL